MTTYFEYGVDLTDNQKSKLASAIKKKFTGNSWIKTSHLRGSDELMLTKRQFAKIQKSIANGTGTDMKMSSAQIGKSVKHGGNLFPSLATLGAKVLPYAVKGISKAAPALATGAVSALGSLGIEKNVWKRNFYSKEIHSNVTSFQKEFTKAQIDQINRAYQTGERLVIKPTRKQIEGGFLGTLLFSFFFF